MKDSGGEWPYTERLLAAHRDLHILVGDERLLARAVRHGGSGAINGFSNFCTPRLLPMIERGEEVPAISALVDLLLRYPVTPGIKALVAHVEPGSGLPARGAAARRSARCRRAHARGGVRPPALSVPQAHRQPTEERR